MNINIDLKSFFLGAIVVLVSILVFLQLSNSGRYQVAMGQYLPVVVDTRTGVVKTLYTSHGTFQYGVPFEKIEANPAWARNEGQ